LLGKVKGRVWKFKDNINSDLIHPSRYFSLNEEIVAVGAMKGLFPEFTDKVKEGDIIVAGENFGCGSGRETAPLSLKLNGISVVLAETFARMFYRNAINISLPVIECKNLTAEVSQGDILEVDLDSATITNHTTNKILQGEKMPAHLAAILEKGGLMNTLD
jgi:3-isopropylmalate/(R)-2-methylmalate dehydratase small subunit